MGGGRVAFLYFCWKERLDCRVVYSPTLTSDCQTWSRENIWQTKVIEINATVVYSREHDCKTVYLDNLNHEHHCIPAVIEQQQQENIRTTASNIMDSMSNKTRP